MTIRTELNPYLETLGLLDRLVAVDTYSPMYVSGLDSLPQFDMMNPDIEQIAEYLAVSIAD